MTRQYYGIENLALNDTQRQTLIDALKQLGDNQSVYPNFRNHRRVRLDGDAVIFEGKFNDADWTIDSIKNKLANIFSISAAVITDSVNQTVYGPVVTFGAGETDRLRMVAFGGLLATWEESHDAVLDYLSNNHLDWESEQ